MCPVKYMSLLVSGFYFAGSPCVARKISLVFLCVIAQAFL